MQYLKMKVSEISKITKNSLGEEKCIPSMEYIFPLVLLLRRYLKHFTSEILQHNCAVHFSSCLTFTFTFTLVSIFWSVGTI